MKDDGLGPSIRIRCVQPGQEHRKKHYAAECRRGIRGSEGRSRSGQHDSMPGKGQPNERENGFERQMMRLNGQGHNVEKFSQHEQQHEGIEGRQERSIGNRMPQQAN